MARPSAAKTTLPRLRVYLAMGLGIVCIALSAIFTREAGIPGTVSAFYRVGIAVVVLAIPFGREADPAEIAKVVIFVASPVCSYMTGSEVVVDGGLSMRSLRLD